jgi:hypothetical protein
MAVVMGVPCTCWNEVMVRSHMKSPTFTPIATAPDTPPTVSKNSKCSKEEVRKGD